MAEANNDVVVWTVNDDAAALTDKQIAGLLMLLTNDPDRTTPETIAEEL
jgi:hypothetical protein